MSRCEKNIIKMLYVNTALLQDCNHHASTLTNHMIKCYQKHNKCFILFNLAILIYILVLLSEKRRF